MTDAVQAQPVVVEPNQDWLLENLIEKYVSLGVGMGITLNVKGTLITGTLCSGLEYLKGVSGVLAEGQEEGSLGHAMAQVFASYTHVYEKPDDAGEDWTPPRVGFVHLKNARFLTPGQKAVPDNPTFWRGRLSSVDGFTVGTMG